MSVYENGQENVDKWCHSCTKPDSTGGQREKNKASDELYIRQKF